MSMVPAMMRATPCMASTSAPSVPISNTQPLHAPEIDLTDSYPNLIHDLSFGSPIGNLPPIDFTFIPNNLPSMNIQPEYITNLITEEVAASCMDGPFTIEEAHYIYGGHFQTCPLGLVEKPGSADL